MAKNTGLTRPVDDLGRIVLPIELRRSMDIKEKDLLEVHVDGNDIILRKFEPTCVFCGSTDVNVITFNGKNICFDCIKELGVVLNT